MLTSSPQFSSNARTFPRVLKQHTNQRDLPVVKISPEWVTGPEQVKSSGRIATFSLWTGMLRDGISSIPGETVIQL